MHIRTTIVTESGERIVLDAIAASRAELDELVEQAYPSARFVSSIIVHREVSAC